jgi:hypothetical protein
MKVKVILFKEFGKYYTEEEWEVPATVRDTPESRERPAIGPYDMWHSPNFRRIGNGAVLIPSQEPWGYPHLFPNRVMGDLK